MRRHPVALTCGRKCHIRERFGSNIEVTKIGSLHVRVVIALRISLRITFDTIGAEERRSELPIHRILPTAAFSAGILFSSGRISRVQVAIGTGPEVDRRSDLVPGTASEEQTDHRRS